MHTITDWFSGGYLQTPGNCGCSQAGRVSYQPVNNQALMVCNRPSSLDEVAAMEWPLQAVDDLSENVDDLVIALGPPPVCVALYLACLSNTGR